MGWINQSLTAISCLGILIACAPKKEGANTHAWEVTAKNGDKMVGCLAEDVTPDILGYIDIESLPDFDIATFEALSIGVEEWEKSGKKVTRSGLANWSQYSHPIGLRDTGEDKIKHCDAYPPPKGTTEWYFSQHTDDFSVEYRLFSLGDKFVFIDARTEY